MSQKLISSFFASKPGASKKKPDDAPKSPEKELNGSGLAKPADVSKESPVKAPRKRRARIMTDSDEDEDAKPASPAKAQPKEEPAEDSKERAAEVSKKEPEEDGVSKGSSQTSQLTSPDGVIKRRTARKTAKRAVEPNQAVVNASKKIKVEAAEKSKSESPEKPKDKVKREDIKEDEEERKAKDSSAAKEEPAEDVAKAESPTEDSKARQKDSPPAKAKEEKAVPKKAAGRLQNFMFGARKVDGSSGSLETDYDPSKAKYDPVKDACWKKGDKVPYLALAKTFEKIDSISARLKMVEVLRNFFRSVMALSPDDMVLAVYLCLNKLAPDYQGVELGVGESLLVKALAEATGRTPDKIKAEVAVKGDLGLVAESSRTNQRLMFAPPPLTLSAVFTKLKAIAEMTGNSVQTKKVESIKSLLVACRQCEARFLVRSLGGKLRIGLAESSLLLALGHAAALSPPHGSPDASKKRLDEAALLVKTAYCECPDYGQLVSALLDGGPDVLPERCRLTPGVPLKPMLAHPTKGVSEVLGRFEGSPFTCEFKYDGERAQIHLLEDGSVRIYSRNQEDNTSKYPDVVGRLKEALSPSTKSCVLDSEAVAWDRPSQTIQPFQLLSTRKRKDANEDEIKVQVCVFAFDLLYLNGKSLVKEPLRKRRSLLREIITEVPGETLFARSADLSTVEDIQEFLEESIRGSCEGLMVKMLDSDATYEIAKRSRNWLKLKKDYLDGVGDTVDVVVLGGYHGKGKRTGTYGGFLLACYDPDNEEFQSLCKIGTGFKEEDLERHSEFFKEHRIEAAKSYYRFDSNLEPDDWFEAVQVWEIKCADLSVSPVHKAALGLVDPEKGISLRFPRFLRIRDDKNPEQATSARQIAELYRNQDHIKNKAPASTANQDEEDFY
ncbi:DNA ligase 1 [Ixodes scapularis]